MKLRPLSIRQLERRRSGSRVFCWNTTNAPDSPMWPRCPSSPAIAVHHKPVGLRALCAIASLELAGNRIYRPFTAARGRKQLQLLIPSNNRVASGHRLRTVPRCKYIELSHNQVKDAGPV